MGLGVGGWGLGVGGWGLGGGGWGGLILLVVGDSAGKWRSGMPLGLFGHAGKERGGNGARGKRREKRDDRFSYCITEKPMRRVRLLYFLGWDAMAKISERAAK